MDIAGKTGTTNKNTDTWFIGFTSKVVIGVYVGWMSQILRTIRNRRQNCYAYFKDFVKQAIKKKEARPFKIAPIFPYGC